MKDKGGTHPRAGKICEQIQTIKSNTPKLQGLRHAYALKKRYGSSSICPKCGGKLIERISKKGEGAGDKFLGCENYPRCRYTREL